MSVPDIAECSVTVDDDGVYHLLHRASGGTATAETVERAEIEGSLLRMAGAYARQIPFRTGDPT